MKTFALNKMYSVISWVKPAKLPEYLSNNGIHPSSEMEVGGRTYRQYDEVAMRKAKVLRREHLQRMNGQQVVPYQPAPEPAPDQIERMTQVIAGIATRVAALTPLIERVDSLHAKLDFLANELSGKTAIFDDEGSGGTD